jgi:hypothetical protein
VAQAEPLWSAKSNAVRTHTESIHGVTIGGGFYAGLGSLSVRGGAVGQYAEVNDGGAVGIGARTTDGGAVGAGSKSGIGFVGGQNAITTHDGTYNGNVIDAIQLGTGGNTNPLSLQIYGYTLMNLDGTIPTARLSALSPSDVGAVATNDARYLAALTNAGAFQASSTNFVVTVSNRLTWIDCGASTGFVFRMTLPGGGFTNVYLTP